MVEKKNKTIKPYLKGNYFFQLIMRQAVYMKVMQFSQTF